MDAIDRAICKGLFIRDSSEVTKQTWQRFEQDLEGKSLVLFGVSVSMRIFLKKYGNRFHIVGVIDNDKGKQGFRVRDFIMTDGSDGDIVISSPSILNHCRKEKTVILVSSLKQYWEIATELSRLGFRYVYSLFLMEANERLNDGNITRDEFGETEKWVDECCKRPINSQKIIFEAYGTYADHGKYITEQLLKLRQDLDIVWVVHNLNTKVPKGIRLIHASNRMQYIYEMETSAIWVMNVILPTYLIKREGQKYIETKHWASVTLKCFYLIESSFKEYKSTETVKYNGSIMDYIITGSDFDSESCRRGFDFHKEFIQIGSPRSDAMFRYDELREKVYQYFQLDQSKKGNRLCPYLSL